MVRDTAGAAPNGGGGAVWVHLNTPPTGADAIVHTKEVGGDPTNAGTVYLMAACA
jgi:hypothetical protein